MTTAIHKSTIGVMIRQAEALQAIVAKGREHLGDGADAFINESLIEDMLPFSFQIRAVCNSSWGNVEAIRAGQAGPPPEMDISSYAQLESLLADYDGTLLVVSHDREFLDNVVTSVIAFEPGGEVREYVGGYSDWARRRQATDSGRDPARGKTRKKPASAAPMVARRPEPPAPTTITS